ncbi:MAG: AI-2E family transporter, partial [Acidobacteriota bacterium]|nr:AI-2E family transporter [Acidobacteriota bacterium]
MRTFRMPTPIAPELPRPSDPEDAGAYSPPAQGSSLDTHRRRDLRAGPFAVRSLSLTGLFVLASFYTLYFARSFFLPIVLGVLLNLLLSPLVRGLKRLHIPEALSAVLVLAALLALVGGGLYQLTAPAYDWMAKAPQSLGRIQAKLRDLKRPMQTLGRATDQMARMTEVTAGTPKTPAITVQSSSLGERLFSQATDLAADAAVMFVLLFFLLASGDLFLRKLIRVLPRLDDKKRAVEIARQVEHDISAYLATVTMINVGLGVAVWISMGLIGLPNPMLWGAMVTLTNYVPYLGAGVCYVVLTLVGFQTFSTLGHALLPPAVFFALNVTEAYFLTPMVLGRRLTLNPVVIFLSLTFWGWLWGITGAVLA